MSHTPRKTLTRRKEDTAVSFNRREVSEERSRNDFLDGETDNVDCGFVLVIPAG